MSDRSRCDALLYANDPLRRCERPVFHEGLHVVGEDIWEFQGIRDGRCLHWEHEVGSDVYGNTFRVYCINAYESWSTKQCKGEHRYDTVACYAQDVSAYHDAQRDAFDAWLARFRPTPFDLDVWRKAFAAEVSVRPEGGNTNHWHWDPAHHALIAVLKLQGVRLPERYERSYGQKEPLPAERMRRVMLEANAAEAQAQNDARQREGKR